MDRSAFQELAANQHGAFGREQLISIGATPATVRRMLRSGSWCTLLPSVYGVVGHSESWLRRLWIAHLHAGTGSVVSHHSAGCLQGNDSALPDRVELIVGAGRGVAPPGVRWHRRDDLLEREVVRSPGRPPMTSAARTAVDLAGVVGPVRLRRFVENAAVAKQLELAEVGAIHARIRRSGKRGVKLMEHVLDVIGPGDAMPHSTLERLGDGVIALAGVPSPTHEHPLPDRRGRRGFVDRAWPDAKLIVEFDGRKWHDRSDQRLHDADRRTEAQVLGWETVQILWEHVVSDAEHQAANLAEIHRNRLALLGRQPQDLGPKPGFS